MKSLKYSYSQEYILREKIFILCKEVGVKTCLKLKPVMICILKWGYVEMVLL